MSPIAHAKDSLQSSAARGTAAPTSQASILLCAALYLSAHFLAFFSQDLLGLSFLRMMLSSTAHVCHSSANPLPLPLFHFYLLPRSCFRSHSLQDVFLMCLPALQVGCVSVHLDHPSSLPPLPLVGGAAGSPALGLPPSAQCSPTSLGTAALINFC